MTIKHYAPGLSVPRCFPSIFFLNFVELLAKQSIKIYSTESFRESYMKPEQELSEMLKPGFGKFFIVPVETLISLIRLPVPPVRSTTHTLIYLTKGEATMTIGSQSYKIFKDECLIVPAGQLYSFAKHDVNTGYLCNFHNDFILEKFGNKDLLKTFEFLTIWGNPQIHLNKQTSAFVLQLLKRLFASYTANGLRDSDLVQSYLVALLCELNSVYTPLSAGKPGASVLLVGKFKALLFDRIKTTQLVNDYAALLHVSPNHLNKTVKSITGKTPGQWIDETLVLEAKVLLYQTALPVSEVATELGIHDPSYFSRLFKKHEKVTPMQFRKKIEMS